MRLAPGRLHAPRASPRLLETVVLRTGVDNPAGSLPPLAGQRHDRPSTGRVLDENSRERVQNVRGDSSAGTAGGNPRVVAESRRFVLVGLFNPESSSGNHFRPA